MKTKKEEKKEKENNIIPILFILIAISLVVALFITQAPPHLANPQQTPFEQQFYRILSLDQKYGGDYRNERLNHTMVNMSNIPLMINELEGIKAGIAGKQDNDSLVLSRFIDVRIGMLNVQRLYQQATMIGPIGTAYDGFRCSEAPYMIKVIDLYNETRVEFWDTMFTGMDSLLYDYPRYRSYIGMEKNKTKFYGSDIRAINQIAEENDLALKKYCQIG